MKNEKKTQCFTYEVKMLVHVIADNTVEARAQLDEKGGIATKRDVELLNSIVLFGEETEK